MDENRVGHLEGDIKLVHKSSYSGYNGKPMNVYVFGNGQCITACWHTASDMIVEYDKPYYIKAIIKSVKTSATDVHYEIKNVVLKEVKK
jgi:hypothetical protein